MEWWNVFATVSTRLARAPFGDDGVGVGVDVGVGMIRRLYADRVAEEGCRRRLRNVSELVWEEDADALAG